MQWQQLLLCNGSCKLLPENAWHATSTCSPWLLLTPCPATLAPWHNLTQLTSAQAWVDAGGARQLAVPRQLLRLHRNPLVLAIIVQQQRLAPTGVVAHELRQRLGQRQAAVGSRMQERVAGELTTSGQAGCRRWAS